MTALVTKHLPLVAGARDGIKKLRALILELAVRGKLVAQDASDTTADSLLADIRVRLQEKSNSARTRKSLISAPVDVDEWPFILPSSWRWARFSEITSYVQRGKGPIYADRSQYPVISQKCVRWTGLDLSQARHIEPSSIDRYEEVRHLVEGDILWNSTGTGTIGRACVVKTTVPGQVLVADSHVTVVRCEGIVPEYLWRWIQTPTVQDQIENSASGSTNQVELNTSTVLAHLAPIPPLAEQHRIVAKVDELMALCDRLEADQADSEAAHAQLVQALLNSLTQATDTADFRACWQRLSEHFHTLFTTEASIDALKQTVLLLGAKGKLVEYVGGDEPATALFSRLVASKEALVKTKLYQKSAKLKPKQYDLGLPGHWLHIQIGSVCPSIVPNRDKPKSFTGNIPWITLPSFPKEGWLLDEAKVELGLTEAEVHDSAARLIPENSVLMSCIGRFGLVAINKIPVVANQQVHAYVVLPGLLPNYLAIALKASIDQLERAATSTTIAYLNKANCESIEIGLPSTEEQRLIVAKIDELMALCDQLKAQLGQAREQHAQLATALIEQAVS